MNNMLSSFWAKFLILAESARHDNVIVLCVGADRVDGVISDGFTELAHVLDLRPPVSRPGEERIASAVC